MRPRPPCIAPWLAACLLGGCVVGPAYHAPSPQAGVEAPFVSARQDLAADNPVPDDWWRLYSDPQLDTLVREALAANHELAAAEANLRAASAVLSGAKAGRYPSTDLEASGAYGRPEIANLLAADVGAKAGADWLDVAGFAVAYQVDLFGQIRRGIEAAGADAQAAQAARDAVRVTVVAQTTAAYADTCALGQSIDVAQRSLALSQKIEQATERRRAAGVDTNLDLARSQALVAQTAAAVPPLEGQRRAALFVLAALLARTPSNLPIAALACRQPLVLSAPIPVGDGRALLRRRPDLRLAERNLAASTARIGVAIGSLYPSVSLGASMAVAADTPSNFGQYPSLSYGLGPLVSWSFPNTAIARARIRQARAGTDAAQDRLDGAVLQALSEVERALSAYGAELDRHGALAEARAHSAQALSLARIQRRDGALPYLDLLNAEQTLIAVDAALAASDRQLAADQVAVFKALGGGWRQAAS